LTNLSFYSAYDSSNNHTHTQRIVNTSEFAEVQNTVLGPGTHYGDADGICGNAAG